MGPASYKFGFAPRDGQPLYSELWRGCVGAWDPGLGCTGPVLKDHSSYRNDLTLTNMNASSWTNSEGRVSLRFDGTDDYAVKASRRFELVSPFSVSIWYRPTARNPYAGLVSTMSAFSESSVNGFILYDGGNSNAGVMGMIMGGVLTLTSGSNSTLNTWQHYCAIFAAGSAVLYKNAVPQTLSRVDLGAAQYTGTTELKIGSFTTTSGRAAADIRDVRLYDRILSPNEVRMLSRYSGIAYQLAQRRRASSGIAFNRRRRLLVGAGS